MSDKTIDCAWCGAQLDDEESAHPERDHDGDPICDDCHEVHFTDTCQRCENRCDNKDFSTAEGSLIAVWEVAPVAGMAGDLEPGYYRILHRPFFANGMIEGYFFSRSLERFAPLDAPGRDATKEAWTISCPLCSSCQDQVAGFVGPHPAQSPQPKELYA